MSRPAPLLHAEITHEIIGAFYDVYNEMGWGFAESVYMRAMCIMLTERGLQHDRELWLPVYFRGEKISAFRADLVVERKVIVELKSGSHLAGTHDAQLLNYLRASGLQVGLLFNFGPKPERRRLIWMREHQLLIDR